ncbi:MAG: histidine kinase [Bacteroidota bacterium]
MLYGLLSSEVNYNWKITGSCLLWLFQFVLFGQSFQPYFHHFGTEDGLPSSEVYCTQQDKQGYIWIGTDNGIARFNGHSFKVFSTNDGLADPVVFSIREDSSGVIWCSTYTKGIFYYDDGIFKPHPQNEIILEWAKGKKEVIKLIDPDYESGFLILTKYLGFFTFSKNGLKRISPGDENELLLYHSTPDPKNKYVNNRTYSLPHFNENLSSYRAFINGESSQSWNSLPLINNFEAYIRKAIKAPGETDAILAFSDTDLWYIKQGRVLARHPGEYSNITYLQPYGGDALLIGRQSSNGLIYLKNWQKEGELYTKAVLEKKSVSYINFDRSGGLWVGSLDYGLYYSPQPTSPFFKQGRDFPDYKLISTEPINDNLYFTSFSDGSTRMFNEYNHQIIDSNRTSFNIVYVPRYNYFTNGFFSATAKQITPSTLSLMNKRKFPKNKIYADNSTSKINLSNNPYELGYPIYTYSNVSINRMVDFSTLDIIETRNKKIPKAKCYIIDWNQNHIIGTLYGLFEISLNEPYFRKRTLSFIDPDQRFTDAIYLPGGSILFGTRGSGLVYYSPDTTYQISITEGLPSDLTRHLIIDSLGSVWVATYDGLVELSFSNLPLVDGYIEYGSSKKEYKNKIYNPLGNSSSNLENKKEPEFQIRTYNEAHGIPNLEIRHLSNSENYLWLTTAEGLLKFKPPPFDSFSIRPTLELVRLDNTIVDMADLANLPNKSSYFLNLSFSVLNFAQLGKNHYRYRIGKDTSWREIDQNELSFSSLPKGNYQFEIQSRNPDGVWSQSLTIPISIAIPWHESAIGRTAIVLLGISLIYFLFKRIDERRKQEFALKQQIQQLERSALQAQMNPHFVFNSLNSIQKFVLRQETKDAVDYLARFAQLVRSTLTASARSVHSLADEISMLENYLNLEKLRFKDGFEYTLEMEDWISPGKVFIPPMLVQPFIENSIKHGLRDQKKGGKIQVKFSGEPSQLQVKVIDNGRGFDPKKSKKYDARERGMDITNRRLELLQKEDNNSNPMQVNLRYDDYGEVCGTEVVIFINTSTLPNP